MQCVPSHVQGQLKPCKYCGATGQPEMNDDSHSTRVALALHSLPRATARKSTRPGMAQPWVLAWVGVRLCMSREDAVQMALSWQEMTSPGWKQPHSSTLALSKLGLGAGSHFKCF